MIYVMYLKCRNGHKLLGMIYEAPYPPEEGITEAAVQHIVTSFTGLLCAGKRSSLCPECGIDAIGKDVATWRIDFDTTEYKSLTGALEEQAPSHTMSAELRERVEDLVERAKKANAARWN